MNSIFVTNILVWFKTYIKFTYKPNCYLYRYLRTDSEKILLAVAIANLKYFATIFSHYSYIKLIYYSTFVILNFKLKSQEFYNYLKKAFLLNNFHKLTEHSLNTLARAMNKYKGVLFPYE